MSSLSDVYNRNDIELTIFFSFLHSSQEHRITPLVAPLPSSAGPLLVHNHLQTNGVHPLRSPSPESEQPYIDKATMLGYCRPSAPHPLADLSSRDRLKAILDHATDCKLPECQLDNSMFLSALLLYHSLTDLALEHLTFS